jgi:pimeloyl-ACP methyl ester carboxylesterase
VKDLRRIIKAASYVLLGIAFTLVITTITNALLTQAERDQYKAPGKVVDVDGKKIHVHTQGSGSQNVVFLSGLGTLSPEIDFRVLSAELKSSFKTNIVEYPGYGWSSDTDQLRSTSNSVEEIRAALRAAQVLPPYILVAHSFSGLQSLLYANKYPKEISGIVGLDISVPEQVNYIAWHQQQVNWYEILRFLGISRIILMFDPTIAVGHRVDITVDEITEYSRITNWVVGSHATFGEANELSTNLRSLLGQKFPGSIPTILVVASEGANYKGPGISGDVWIKMHQDILEKNATSRMVILEGDHYIHHQNESKIAALVREIAKANN